MSEIFSTILGAVIHAVKDTAIVFCWLFAIYLVIQILEYKLADNLTNTKLLNGKCSPLVISSLGMVPQCGFSVVATDLYSKKALTMGGLIALYIATSDEAIPLLLANPSHIIYLLPLIGIKFVLAVIVGYGFMAFDKIKTNKQASVVAQNIDSCCGCGHEESNSEAHDDSAVEQSKEDAIEKPLDDKHNYGCCGHDITGTKHPVKRFLLHPLLHSLKVAGFILAVNIVLEIIIGLITRDAMIQALDSIKYLQPLVTTIFGLIPNCASSVVITTLFIDGGLTFGATMSGLITNAGIGFAVLFRKNKNIKDNIKIIGIMCIIGFTVGMILSFFPI